MKNATFKLKGGGATTNLPTHLFAAGAAAPQAFRMSVRPETRITVPSSTSNIVIHDANVVRDATPTTVQDFVVTAEYVPFAKPPASSAITFSSLDTAKQTVSANQDGLSSSQKRFSYVSSGAVTLRTSNGIQTIDTPVTSSTTTSSNIDTVSSYVTGSLTKHIRDYINGIVSSVGATPDLQLYNLSTLVWNTNVWLPTVDFTCISLLNTSFGNWAHGTLVSPRHLVTSNHIHPNLGDTLTFVKLDGTKVTRTIIDMIDAPGYTPYYPDLHVSLLDSDVPAGISYAKVLPTNYKNKIYSEDGCPVVSLNQFGQLSIRSVYLSMNSVYDNQFGFAHTYGTTFRQILTGSAAPYYVDIIVGDSSAPSFTIINGAPILLTCFTYGGAGSGTSITGNQDVLNSMMHTLSVRNSLSSDYQITNVDLSGFPDV